MSASMNADAAPKIVSSLVKALQVVCHGYVEFDQNIEIVGHIHINVDRKQKFNYILNELVKKADGRSSTFVSSSFYAKAPDDKLESSKNIATESHREKSPLCTLGSDILPLASSLHSSDSDRLYSSITAASILRNQSQQPLKQKKRDAHGVVISHKSGAFSSSSHLSPVHHISDSDDNTVETCANATDAKTTVGEKRCRPGSSVDQECASPREQSVKSIERTSLDLLTDSIIHSNQSTTVLSSQQNKDHLSDLNLHSSNVNNSSVLALTVSQPKEEDKEDDVVVIKEEVCEEDVLQACGGPVINFHYDPFSSQAQSAMPSRFQSLPMESTSRGGGLNPDSAASDFMMVSPETHSSAQSHLYPVSMHANLSSANSALDARTGAMSMVTSEASSISAHNSVDSASSRLNPGTGLSHRALTYPDMLMKFTRKKISGHSFLWLKDMDRRNGYKPVSALSPEELERRRRSVKERVRLCRLRKKLMTQTLSNSDHL